MDIPRKTLYPNLHSDLPLRSLTNTQFGHSSVVNPLGDVIAEADEKEAIVYADIGAFLWIECSTDSPDPELLATTRRNLPVTIQRRFNVYPDVAGLSK
jgi:predicted amidohydrolase